MATTAERLKALGWVEAEDLGIDGYRLSVGLHMDFLLSEESEAEGTFLDMPSGNPDKRVMIAMFINTEQIWARTFINLDMCLAWMGANA